MNLTVSLGTTQQRLHPTMRNQDAVIGIVQLQQPPDGSLFVIGDIRAKMQMGLAMFSNMALQPVTPPISNREYEFRCELFIACHQPALQQRVCLGRPFQDLQSARMLCCMLRPDLRTGHLLKAHRNTVCTTARCRFAPAWGAGNDLLRQVKPVSVVVKLLRCTLGMHMTVRF